MEICTKSRRSVKNYEYYSGYMWKLPHCYSDRRWKFVNLGRRNVRLLIYSIYVTDFKGMESLDMEMKVVMQFHDVLNIFMAIELLRWPAGLGIQFVY